MQNLIGLVMLYANASSLYTLPLAVFYMWGLWFVFKKCGLPGWHAVVPFVRERSLGRCGDVETEGISLAILRGVLYVMQVILSYLSYMINAGTAGHRVSTAYYLLLGLALLNQITQFIVSLRISLALCDTFARRKRWAWLWAFFGCIPAMIWGLSKKFVPQWTVPEMDKDAEIFFSGNTTAVLENGLTVNLNERTVRSNYKKITLLRDIHLSIEPGRMVLLLGGSGSGKTTLVNAVNGYEKADAKVLLNGRDLYANYKDMMYDIGFVPQQDLMRENDTVLSTLMDAAMLHLPAKFTRAERIKRVNEMLEMFGLAPVKNSLAGKLSGGQRKRLSIALEFIPNPSLFILDEPDSGLDGVMARTVMEQLHAISRQGKIVIVITHTPDRVIDLFDDVIVLAKDSTRAGRLAWFGPIADARRFFERDTMEQVVRCINRPEEGGEGRADEFVKKFAEVQKNG